jgi:hypothetical protein
MSTIEIRKAFLADLKLLQNIGIQTFSETFSLATAKKILINT